MTRLVLLALLLSGCPSGGGLTPIWAQQGRPLNSVGSCVSDSTLLPAADLALVLLAREAVAAGYGYEATAKAIKRPGVCLLQRPEPCCLGSVCQIDTDGAKRDKAGCTIPDGALWISKEWPAGTARDWRADLLHELSHIVAAALFVTQRRDHQVPWAEVEARALAAYRAALGVQ